LRHLDADALMNFRLNMGEFTGELIPDQAAMSEYSGIFQELHANQDQITDGWLLFPTSQGCDCALSCHADCYSSMMPRVVNGENAWQCSQGNMTGMFPSGTICTSNCMTGYVTTTKITTSCEYNSGSWTPVTASCGMCKAVQLVQAASGSSSCP